MNPFEHSYATISTELGMKTFLQFTNLKIFSNILRFLSKNCLRCNHVTLYWLNLAWYGKTDMIFEISTPELVIVKGLLSQWENCVER